MTYREVLLTLSEPRFEHVVDRARRATREEVFRATGIRKATRRVIDPVRRRKLATSRLRTWIEEQDEEWGNRVAQRLLYDALANAHRALVVDVLDHLQIPHQDGMSDDLSRLANATPVEINELVETLSAKHPRADIALYLHFTAADPEMSPLAKTLEQIPELAAALAD